MAPSSEEAVNIASVVEPPSSGHHRHFLETVYAAYVDDVDDVNRTWVAKAILADLEWDAISWEHQRLALAELFEVEEDMVESVVTTEFIEGFLEGAGDVWDQVKHEL